MKVVKDQEHGLIFNCFGLKDRFYLSMAVMTFFAFDNPDEPMKEKEMWPFIQEELGKEAIFDMVLPKPMAEALVWGRCFAPDGTPVPALQASLVIGPIRKTVYVFGDRHWKKTGLGMTISEPEPFSEMPLTWERAFGGSGFERNPSGRGAAAVIAPSGEELRPLPNIEDPRHLIGSPGDRPEPAGFGPLDCTWPQRSKKLGTYDDKWLQENWPFYPDDMDWTYFNAAPEDQQMEVFFNGNESFVIGNMHKTKPVIESRLPNIRRRLFVNRRAGKGQHEEEEVFSEVRTHIDTVWLFPHAGRGVVIHRGSAVVEDDEAADVLNIFVATEDPSAQAKTLEQLREEFRKRLERKIPEDAAAAMAQADRELVNATERLRDLPQEIMDAIDAGSGQAPAPVRTHDETIAGLMAFLDGQGPLLDEGEKRLLETKAEFGHVMKIDASAFQKMRQQIVQSKADLQAASAMLHETEADWASAEGEAQEAYKKALGRIDPAILRKHGVAPELPFGEFRKKPEELWHERGMRFVERCRDDLKSRPEYMELLTGLGFRPYTLKRAWIGTNPVAGKDDPALWGLPGENKSRATPRELDITSGIVIPCFNGAKLHRIRISSFHHIYPPPEFPRLTFETGRKLARDSVVEGSGEAAMVLGADEGKPFIRVAYEFEALLLNQELAGAAAVIAMKDPGVKPDKETEGYLKEAPQFLVVQYPGSEETADRDMDMWKAVYPKAEPLPIPQGANLFSARKLGVDLWQWVADALKPGVAPDPERNPNKVDMHEPGALAAFLAFPDIEVRIKKARDRIMAEAKADLKAFGKEQAEMREKVRKTLESKGLKADDLMKHAEEPVREGNPFASMKEEYDEYFARTREVLKKKGLLTPDMEKTIAESEKQSRDLLARATAQYDEGIYNLAAAQVMPDWARKLLADAGIDPDNPQPAKPLTREEVIEWHGSGRSLAKKDLSRLDLSGLDLSGVDLRGADLHKTVLCDCTLDGADLSGAMAREADFSHASMKKACMNEGSFGKAKFGGADLSEGSFTMAMMDGSDLSGANLTDAVLEKTIFQETSLKKANLARVRAARANFNSVDASFADFSGADLTKALFLKSSIEEANFSGALMRSVLFLGTRGKKVNFQGADMHNSRIVNNSAMTESTFTGVTADRACWIKSDLAGSDFRGAAMTKGLIQECDLSRSNLSGMKARETRITKTNLSDANMEKTGLFFGSLRRSKLVRTDLRGANLYGAEFYRTGVGDTRFDGANLKMTKLYKRIDLLPDKKDKG